MAAGAKFLGNPPENVEPFPTTIIPGAPNAAIQFEIAFSRDISAVWSSFFLAPVNDGGETWKSVQNVQICRYRNIPLQKVIRGHLERLWDNVRRHRYFKDITQQIIDGVKRKKGRK